MRHTWCLSPLPLQSAQHRLEYRFFCKYSDHSVWWLQAVRNEKLLLSVVPSPLCSHLRLCYASWHTYMATAIHNVRSSLHGLNTKQTGLPCCARHTLLQTQHLCFSWRHDTPRMNSRFAVAYRGGGLVCSTPPPRNYEVLTKSNRTAN
jgi:hypothetical protein